jgi:hypothetical protein
VGRANSIKERARKSGSRRSALTEFAPTLRRHICGIRTSESHQILHRSQPFVSGRILGLAVQRVESLHSQDRRRVVLDAESRTGVHRRLQKNA